MNRYVFGILLVIVGIFLLLNYFLNLNLELWPLALVVPGILFIFGATKENYGLYIPGFILLFLGIFFFFNVYTDWEYHHYLWPIYTLTVSLTFYLTSFFGKEKDLILPANILLLITFGLFFISCNLLKFWPVILILAGIWVIFTPFYHKNKGKAYPEDK